MLAKALSCALVAELRVSAASEQASSPTASPAELPSSPEEDSAFPTSLESGACAVIAALLMPQFHSGDPNIVWLPLSQAHGGSTPKNLFAR